MPAPSTEADSAAVEWLRRIRAQRDVSGADEIEAKARESLRAYLELIVWPTVEPSTPFVGGFHIDAICEHLEAVSRREIRNLLVTVPPRHTKSLCASVAWPTWAWIDYPEHRFLFSSFSHELSIEHAVLSRRVIEGRFYQERWSDRFRMTSDQNVKAHYENTKRGYRISTSVGGTTTGRGGDFLVVDDPHNLKKVHSDAERRSAIEWYKSVWSTRFNDPKTGCQVVIMQRGHDQDLAGYILEHEAVEHLKLPTEFDPARRCTTSIGWEDPRQEAGELLAPDRFGPDEVERIKRLPMVFSTQHQQEPTPFAGSLFKRDKLTVITALPGGQYVEGRGWDIAATEDTPGEDPDFTAGIKMRVYENGAIVVVHAVRGRFGPAEGDEVMRSTAVSDGTACRQREEQEPGASGKKVVASHTKLLAGFDYQGSPSTGSKVVRSMPFVVQVDAGNVSLLRGEWNEEYIDELTRFPNGKHDDQVDASSNIYNDLALQPTKSWGTWGR